MKRRRWCSRPACTPRSARSRSSRRRRSTAVAAAERDRRSEPHRSPRWRSRIGLVVFVIGRVHRPVHLCQLHLRHRHHRRERAGRTAADRDAGAGAGRAAAWRSETRWSATCPRRDARVRTVICTDKTGTLTQNRMEIRAALRGRRVRRRCRRSRLAASPTRHRRLFECAACCHDLKDARRRRAPALAGRSDGDGAGRDGSNRAWRRGCTFDRIDEIPFESERKRLSTLHRVAGEAVVVHAKARRRRCCRAANVDRRQARRGRR